MWYVRLVVVGVAVLSATPSLARPATQTDVDAYTQSWLQTYKQAFYVCLRAYTARAGQDHCIDRFIQPWDTVWRAEHSVVFSLAQEAEIRKHLILFDALNDDARSALARKFDAERHSRSDDDEP